MDLISANKLDLWLQYKQDLSSIELNKRYLWQKGLNPQRNPMKSSKNSVKNPHKTENQAIRIDKWLWACRFYKTRAIAKTAIDGGKVEYNGHKCKPSRCVALGDQVKLRQGFDEKTVIITGLSERRQSASIAQTLYKETEESIQKRLQIAEMRKIGAPKTQGKPDKKQRRQIHRFKNIGAD